jgi:hypothetical protein
MLEAGTAATADVAAVAAEAAAATVAANGKCFFKQAILFFSTHNLHV